MAGDWIAWVKGLAKRREVVVMAETLKMTRRAVASCCMEWWEWCDSEGDFDPARDCHVTGVTFVTGLSLIDEHVGVTGFGQAMADVGWAKPDEAGDLTHPALGKWTGSAAKERLRANDRQVRRRAAIAKTSRPKRDKSVTREEKRRKKKEPPTPFQPLKTELPGVLDVSEFQEAWGLWVQHRIEIKAPLTPTSVKQQLKEFEGWGPTRSIRAIRHTTKRGWRGIREPEGSPVAEERPELPVLKPYLQGE